MFSLGNVLYSILTRKVPFENEKRDKVPELVMRGGRPKIAQAILESQDPFDQSMLKAIQMCWIQDPKERATARQVQRFITSELERLGVQQSKRQ